MIFKKDIEKHFDRNKKRDLSNQSKTADDPKRQHEQSPKVSCLENPTSPGDVFEESLKSDDCVQILMNYPKNLEKEVKELHSLAKSNHENQVEAEKRLQDLSDSVHFISNKFEELEKDKKEKEQIFNDIKGEVATLDEIHNTLSSQIGQQEHYSCHNCLLIHGVPEHNKDKDEIAKKFFNKNEH